MNPTSAYPNSSRRLNGNHRAEPSDPFLDPREEPAFMADLYPTADGQAPPPAGSQGVNDRLILEFLRAYYHINVESTRLRRLRELDAADETEMERAALRRIDQALVERDQLEDRYAPRGVIAEPVMRDGLAVDVRFTFGNVNALGRFRSHPIVFSGTIEVRLPHGVRPHDLSVGSQLQNRLSPTAPS